MSCEEVKDDKSKLPAAKSGAATTSTSDDDPTETAPHHSDNNGEDKGASGTVVDENGKPLSKNQLKKRKRWERAMEIKTRRKQQEKEVKRAKATAQGRNLEQEKIEQKKRAEEGLGRKRRQEEWETKYLLLAKKSWQVCIDCSFEEQLTTKEINSLSIQIRYCYANNKNCPHPCLLNVSSLAGKTLENLQNVAGFDSWTQRALSFSDKPLNKVFNDRLNDVVYLTSDSENVVEDLEDSKIYIIGGMIKY
jgi:tRNA (guanine9-N1)-methyltransferase